MNKLAKDSVSLHIPPRMWHSFCSVLRQARSTHEEVIGFFLCQRHLISKSKIRYFPKAWVVPAPDCYEHQSESGLVLKQPFHHYLLDNFLETEGWDVVHIHTHAHSETPNFSHVDDRYEAEYARFLSSSFKSKPRLISGVFDESLQHPQFRIWNRSGSAYEQVSFCSDWLEQVEPTADRTDPMFSRQAIFGDIFQDRLAELTVTLIGCGGIGATFAEQLGRLGVKQWVLVDPDRLETSNLNRMPGATQRMADQKWHKVDYVKHLIKRIYATGSSVRAFPTIIEDQAIEKEIAATDIIIVATDNHHSRQTAQEIALKYQRPLVCLGTHIDVQADGLSRLYCRVTVPPLGGGWCLMCGNIINLQQSALESAPSDIHHLAAERGYLQGVHAPAVFWLNSMCASTGVGIIQSLVSGALNFEAGLDWIYEFPSCTWIKANPEHLINDDCLFCSMPVAVSQTPEVSSSSDDHEFLSESYYLS